ncbi:hypothetical protein BGZ58_003875 [Dissophora ornata]|nr:hypothetical protein BGZ58_003875 [Dissophora ornata]
MAVEDYDGFHGVGSFPETTGFDSASASALTSQRNSHETAATGQSEDEYSTQISFVYANEKRSGDFHALFRSVPENEKLIEDYGCALQKEILVQGRIHISENHVCFNANIFGWVTILVIAFSEITAIEKRLTAFVIPNAISIVTTTNTKGHFFASFLSRDAAHDLLMAAWRKSFPCAANASAASSAHGNYRHNRYNMTINDDEDSNDAQSFISSARGNSESRKNRHRRSFSNASQTWTGDESNGNWDDDDDTKSNTGILRRGSKRAAVKKLIKDVIAPIIPDDDYLRNGSLSPTSIGKKSGRGRSVSELPPRPTSFDIPRNRDSVVSTRSSFDEISLALPVNRPRSGTESSPKLRSSPTVVATLSKQTTPSSPPPAAVAVTGAEAAHRTPTTCKDGRHYPSQFMLETYPGSIQSMWKLLFDSEFNKNFLTSEAMKGADVQEEPWQQTADGMSTKATRYTKWIGMPIGPKTTKAILTDVVEHRDLDEYVTTVTTTSTPDVPSGGSFTTKCRTCITWAGPNQVQVEVTGGVEFSKSSWIKGQIEKGAAEGLTTHFKELNKSIRKFIAANPNIFAGAGSSSTVNTASAGGAVAIEAKAAMPEGYVVGSRESLPSSVASTRSSGGQGFESQDIAQSKTIPAGTSPSSLGIWSALSKAMEWNHGAASHLAFVSILVIVMFANVYIYLQISSVSSQIERIQNDILYVDPHHYYHHHDQHPDVYHPPSASSPPHHSRTPPSSAGSGWMPSQPRKVLDDIEREERFARDQEEAMWAWLTEREARHRQYRAGKGARADNNERQSAPGPGPAVNVKDEHKLTETEAKLHAKIVQLQERLASLELQGSSITVESRAIEQDLSP